MESLLWHTVQHYPSHSEKVSSVNRLPILLAAAVIGLSACSAERISNFPSYKLKVIQGNQLDARAVSSLQQGMSRDQVQLLLGTPLLRDPFHSEEIEKLQDKIAEENGYRIVDHALYMYGVCGPCQKKEQR